MNGCGITAYYTGQTSYEADDFTITQWKTEDIGSLPESLRPIGGERKAAFAVKGYHVQRLKGVLFQLQGRWATNRKGLVAFDVKAATPIEPDDSEHRIIYLSSGLLKGIGKKQAIDIDRKFGSDTFQVLKTNPELLLAVPEIGMSQLKKVRDSYKKTHFAQELHALIGSEDIPAQAVQKIYRALGEDAIGLIRKNPYVLSSLAGISFLTADAIAMRLSLPADSRERAEAGAEHVFSAGRKEGHLYLPRNYLIQELMKLLNQSRQEKIGWDVLVSRVSDMEKQGIIVAEQGNFLYPALYAQMEKETAEIIARMNHSEILYDKSEYSEAMTRFLHALPLKLSEQQDRAIRFALVKRVAIITGGPGTGKTTILKGIIDIYQTVNPEGSIFLLAPTGRATRRASEATGLQAYTVDRMLVMLAADDNESLMRAFQRGLVICDEMSMVDARRMWGLMKCFTAESHFVMVGDANQLPAVEAGDVLRQLIMSRCIFTVTLDVVYRQGEDSSICVNAHRMIEGKTELLYNRDFQMIEASTEEQAEETMEDLFLRLAQRHGFENVALLTPRRRKSIIGSDHVNKSIQEARFAGNVQGRTLHANGCSFAVGDRVMETQNNDKANNGDVGTIVSIAPYKEDDRLLFKAGIQLDGMERPVSFTQDDMSTVTLGYCLTIHKSQGSEYSYVVIPVMESNKGMLKRNLLYTAVTRAKKGVYLVGQKRMVEHAIKSVDTGKRNTMLAEFLRREEMNYKGAG